DLSADVLALVPDALALVRLRRPHLADLRGDLTDLLLVDALDPDLGRCRHLEGDAEWRLDRDRMRVADVELERRPAQRRAVADALDLEALFEALRDTLHHVRDQRPGQAVECPVLAAVGRPRDDERVVPALHSHAGRHALR